MLKSTEPYEKIKEVNGDDMKWLIEDSKFIYSLSTDEQQKLKNYIIRDALDNLIGKVIQRRNPLLCGELNHQYLSGLNVQIALKLIKAEYEILYD
ncbi:protein of unknown function [Xenorhabdus poinarii G6]|uniref:Uncharacterized protein n=1 Tax=Xenorhabdus poinarii G6 TaxID=1354304 RepID=A0A068QXZ0_9GAMM|nr:hypothetical protein [Xenorhabdus poinarii]CDG19783.1 protein of unknown function [Xenorhabdus poinarii G6]